MFGTTHPQVSNIAHHLAADNQLTTLVFGDERAFACDVLKVALDMARTSSLARNPDHNLGGFAGNPYHLFELVAKTYPAWRRQLVLTSPDRNPKDD